MALKRKIDLLTVVVVLSFGIVFSITFRSYRNIIENEEAVRLTNGILLNIHKALTNGVDMETGSRGYILTGKKEFLEPFEAARQTKSNTIDTLRNLLTNDPAQKFCLDTLEILLEKRRKISDAGVALSQRQHADPTAILTEVSKGKLVMDSIRVLVRRMETIEMSKLLHRMEVSKKETLQSRNYLFLISVLTLLFVFTFYSMLRRNAFQLQGANLAQQATLDKLTKTNNELLASKNALALTVQKLTDIRHQLEESENRYRLISTHSKDLISLYGIDQDPSRIYISPSCKDILGYEPEEMIGRSAFDFIHPEDAKQMQEIMHPKTLSGNSSSMQYRAIRKDGTIIWLETISNPYFDHKGNMTGFQTAARDITKHKDFEAALILARNKAEDATAKLTQLWYEKNDLIGLFSHDMKAPINQVRGLAKIMTTFIDDKQTLTDCISKLNQTANRQLALYQDVLFMMKSDQAGLDSRSVEMLSLHSIVSKVSDNMVLELNEKRIKLQNNISQIANVSVDPELFTQAVQNLLSNAIKFSYPDGTIAIDAVTEENNIRISIIDNGMGFNPYKAERLFDRFTKEGKQGTNNEDSTGLGLYLVRKIIENHKGTITAFSSGENMGATFTILLPK